MQPSKTDSHIHRYTGHWHSNTLKCMCTQARSQLLTTRSGFTWRISNTAVSIYVYTKAMWAVNNSTIALYALTQATANSGHTSMTVTVFLWSDATAIFRCMLVFVWLLFEGGVYFFADQVRTSDTVMIARYGQHTRSLPASLTANRENESFNTNYSHTCACAAFILRRFSDCAATIRERRLFKAEMRYRIHRLISAYAYFQNCKEICA